MIKETWDLSKIYFATSCGPTTIYNLKRFIRNKSREIHSENNIVLTPW